jgi:hypothetical protein
LSGVGGAESTEEVGEAQVWRRVETLLDRIKATETELSNEELNARLSAAFHSAMEELETLRKQRDAS